MSISRIRAESQLRTLSEQLVSIQVDDAAVVAVATLYGLPELDSQHQRAAGGGGGCSHTRTLRLRLE
jgi:hypothetical protein